MVLEALAVSVKLPGATLLTEQTLAGTKLSALR
jgi:hypothetical protein